MCVYKRKCVLVFVRLYECKWMNGGSRMSSLLKHSSVDADRNGNGCIALFSKCFACACGCVCACVFVCVFVCVGSGGKHYQCWSASVVHIVIVVVFVGVKVVFM
jgi:hypothetical protein